ncbi:MAG TPA: hypothetical protein VJX67_24295 [Blastocatellia bacterium]|nr:hypothetical protein [Blastocatellia bacterium]
MANLKYIRKRPESLSIRCWGGYLPVYLRGLVASALLPASAILLSILTPIPALAHNGPPFQIIWDRKVGPCVISVWADPNVGIGTFYVIVDPPPGGSIPADLEVQIGVQPTSGRLAEAFYSAEREKLRGQVQYKAVIPFDRREFWRIHIKLHSAQSIGETDTTVEVTPVGLGRWDMLLYLFPFLLAGFLWLLAVVRGRARRANVAQAGGPVTQ